MTTNDTAELRATEARIAEYARIYQADMRKIHISTAGLFVVRLLFPPAVGLLAYWVWHGYEHSLAL